MSNKEIEDALYWLLDTSDNKHTRGSGRTTMLANVYCRLLKDNLGKDFTVRDHFPFYRADKDLANSIVKELSKDPLNKVSIRENILTLYRDE